MHQLIMMHSCYLQSDLIELSVVWEEYSGKPFLRNTLHLHFIFSEAIQEANVATKGQLCFSQN